jgi:anti-sigma28 factor (negative regulator of flagellin synthesis)
MIISRAEIRSAVAAYSVKRKNQASSIAFDTADTFVHSEAAISLAELAHSAASQPLYRSDLVNDLQRRIAEGRYFVPTDDIVDKLLGRLIVEYTAA